MNQRVVQNIVAAFVLLALCSCLWFGFKVGRDIARTKYAVKNVYEVLEGLEEFFLDQNRYPTATEFANVDLMQKYISNFPPKKFVQKTCTNGFTYATYRQVAFTLEFCLPRSRNEFSKGKNIVTEKTSIKESD